MAEENGIKEEAVAASKPEEAPPQPAPPPPPAAEDNELKKVDVELSVTVDDKKPELNLKSENPINSSTPPEKDDESKSDKRLELYKLEYTTGASRHEDIYKSMWTNFSYMAFLAGGILTFGKGAFPPEIIVGIATTPLMFWFWASYLPLDGYGKDVAARMSELEKLLSQNYITDSKNTVTPSSDKTRMKLYTTFEERKNQENWIVKLMKCLKEKIRVVYSVGAFALIVHLICLTCFIIGGYKALTGKYIADEKPTTEQKLESINNTLGQISNSMKNTERSGKNPDSENKAEVNSNSKASANR